MLFQTLKMLAAAGLLLAPAAAMAQEARGVTVVQKSRAFRPAEISIARGQAITFTNEDPFLHQMYVASPDFSFDSEERSTGQTLTETFTQSGTFQVRCHIHPKMKLVVNVK